MLDHRSNLTTAYLTKCVQGHADFALSASVLSLIITHCRSHCHTVVIVSYAT